MLTDADLLIERTHPHGIGGTQRIYRFKNGMGLSLVNSPMLHAYPYAWEAAVVSGVGDNGNFKGLDYSTPLTEDVEVFRDDDEANAFIDRARQLFDV